MSSPRPWVVVESIGNIDVGYHRCFATSSPRTDRTLYFPYTSKRQPTGTHPHTLPVHRYTSTHSSTHPTGTVPYTVHTLNSKANILLCECRKCERSEATSRINPQPLHPPPPPTPKLGASQTVYSYTHANYTNKPGNSRGTPRRGQGSAPNQRLGLTAPCGTRVRRVPGVRRPL